jgi:hypothetical protein
MRNPNILQPVEIVKDTLAVVALAASGLILPATIGVTPVVAEAVIPEELVLAAGTTEEFGLKQKEPLGEWLFTKSGLSTPQSRFQRRQRTR